MGAFLELAESSNIGSWLIETFSQGSWKRIFLSQIFRLLGILLSQEFLLISKEFLVPLEEFLLSLKELLVLSLIGPLVD